MQKESVTREKERSEDGDAQGDERRHEVAVVVDGKRHEVKSGRYVVSEFKSVVHVDAAKELEQIVDGQLVPLEDNATIVIKGGEQFVSHVRRGGSS